MGGICGFSVKRLSRCYISIDLLKIEPGHFPEAELRFQPQDWARHEQVQWVTVEWRPWVISLTVSVLLCNTLVLLLKLVCATYFFYYYFFFFVHRVEFQTKFYSGQGFKFLPFTFESILDGRLEEWHHLILESRWDASIVILVCDDAKRTGISQTFVLNFNPPQITLPIPMKNNMITCLVIVRFCCTFYLL